MSRKTTKKGLREAVEGFLALPVSDPRLRENLTAAGLPEEERTNRMALVLALWQLAAKGDVRGAKLLLELLGSDSGGQEVHIHDDV